MSKLRLNIMKDTNALKGALTKKKKKVLYITPTLYYPPVAGNYLRVYNVIKALNKVVDLDILYLGEPSGMGGNEALNHIKTYCRNIYTYQEYPSLFIKGVRYYFKYIYWYNLILRILKKDHYDVLWLGFGNITYSLVFLRLITGIPLVVDTDAIYSRFALRTAPHVKGFSKKWDWYWRGYPKILAEIIGTNIATITTAVSEFDSKYYLKITPFKKRIKILSNIVDINSFDNSQTTEYPINHPSICYSGSMANPGNDEAAMWLLDNVMPKLWKKHPTLTVYIVGDNPSAELVARKNDRVIITGRVKNVVSYLRQVDAVVVSLHFESGTRYKILEAWASRQAVISTTLGAEGLNYVHGKHILIADNPEDFTEQVDKVLKNKVLKNTLASNGYELVKSDYSTESAIKEIISILESIK